MTTQESNTDSWFAEMAQHSLLSDADEQCETQQLYLAKHTAWIALLEFPDVVNVVHDLCLGQPVPINKKPFKYIFMDCLSVPSSRSRSARDYQEHLVSLLASDGLETRIDESRFRHALTVLQPHGAVLQALIEYATKTQARTAMKHVRKAVRIMNYHSNYLATHNLRLVMNIARGYMHRGLALSDLFQGGCFGFLRAVQQFNPRLGLRLSTYATYWLRQKLERDIHNFARAIRIPVHKHNQPEMIDKNGVPFAWVSNSLDEQSDQQSMSLHEVLPSDQVMSPDRSFEHADMQLQVQLMLDTLPQREKEILACRFGLFNQNTLSVKEIAVNLGISDNRVRQLIVRGLARLHDHTPELLAQLTGDRPLT